jgi:hypothetical protein
VCDLHRAAERDEEVAHRERQVHADVLRDAAAAVAPAQSVVCPDGEPGVDGDEERLGSGRIVVSEKRGTGYVRDLWYNADG